MDPYITNLDDGISRLVHNGNLAKIRANQNNFTLSWFFNFFQYTQSTATVTSTAAASTAMVTEEEKEGCLVIILSSSCV